MKINIELEHINLHRARIDINGKTLIDADCNKIFNHTLNINKTTLLEIWFWPWKISPHLRVDRHLLNYGIAQIDQYDHMLKLNLRKNFMTWYGEKLVESRIKSAFGDGPVPPDLYDNIIGWGKNRHLDLIQQIKQKIK